MLDISVSENIVNQVYLPMTFRFIKSEQYFEIHIHTMESRIIRRDKIIVKLCQLFLNFSMSYL